ncbi:hypothetical protein QTP88_019008 [Uroleucon formosanum]
MLDGIQSLGLKCNPTTPLCLANLIKTVYIIIFSSMVFGRKKIGYKSICRVANIFLFPKMTQNKNNKNNFLIHKCMYGFFWQTNFFTTKDHRDVPNSGDQTFKNNFNVIGFVCLIKKPKRS